MEYTTYWNDEAVERKKAYWVNDIHDRRLLDYLQNRTNLQRCFEAGLAYADERLGAVRGTVLDLGAGVCWTAALVSRWPHVERVHAFDYSAHRLFKIAPLVFEQFDALQDKIERHCKPMWPVPWPREAADMVIFCQALYMNDDPTVLLHDVHCVLRPGGVVMIACESITAPWLWRWAARAKRLLRHPPRQWRPFLAGRLPDASGRYEYFGEQYERFIRGAGFQFLRQRLEYPMLKETRVVAENYFGVKAG